MTGCILMLITHFFFLLLVQKDADKRCTEVYRPERSGASINGIPVESVIVPLSSTIISWLIVLFCIMYQGSIAEFTVALKLNQGTNPKSGCNRFRAAFCATFFRKKVAEKKQGVWS